MDQKDRAQKKTEFTPPRHWSGVEELQESYWNDAKAQELRGQEFSHKPIETLEMIERADSKGIVRRDFLTIMGASMALASLSCARRPVNKIVPYVNKPPELTPGVANEYASVHPESGAGVLVRTREGRPIKLEGNPDHPMSRGKLGIRAQASLLDLYDPDRLQFAVRITRSDGGWNHVPWSEADQKIIAELKKAARSGKAVRILAGPSLGFSERRLCEEFLSSFSNGRLVQFDPLSSDDVVRAQEASYGNRVIPRYDFEKAQTVVSLGADFLGAGGTITDEMGWSKNRNPDRNGKLSKVYTVESTLTVTGANSDERFAVRPGEERLVGLAIAHELIKKRRSSFANDPSVQSALRMFTPENVAQQINWKLRAFDIRKMAGDLWKSRGRSIVIGGGIHAQTPEAVGLQVIVNFLNSALGNEGKTVDGMHHPYFPQGSFEQVSELISEMQSGRVGVLLVYGTNPVYTLPESSGFQAALKKVPFVVSANERVDETGRASNYIVPSGHFLENWGDQLAQQGVYSVQQPVISPMYETRAFGDSLLYWIREAKLSAGGIARGLPSSASFHDYLRKNWSATVHSSGGFETFWQNALQKGGHWARRSGSVARRFNLSSLRMATKKTKPSSEMTLALYSKAAMRDGASANNAWLQEAPDPISTITWDNYLNVAPSTAKEMGIQTHDVVRLKTPQGEIELAAHVQPGLHPDVVSVAIGYGRTSAGFVAKSAGVNVFPLVEANRGRLIYSGQSAVVEKTGKRYELAVTQGHHRTEGRPIVNDITLKEFRKKPDAENHTNPHLRLEVPSLWPEHNYSEGYRWAMAIDLNSCTGCNACVVACQAENNIPVVGRDQVRVGREMHWIRLDRFYAGSADDPDVVFEPMLCQHCENASCETVCPVLATVHDDEGLNEMIYNRCVGTRYCQNNCPYKVRRFNFFDHWKEIRKPQEMAYNPDVTVRSRGIMEKCSFCVQRIQDAKRSSKIKGKTIQDGDLVVACQQTCPTDAIVFGDLNDPNSRVSQMTRNPRGFHVLQYLGNKPSITYLSKVRNKEKGAEHVHHHS